MKLARITDDDPDFGGQWGIVAREWISRRSKYHRGGPAMDVLIHAPFRVGSYLATWTFGCSEIAEWRNARGVVQRDDGSLEPLD